MGIAGTEVISIFAITYTCSITDIKYIWKCNC
jgi:hypothetical protein